MIPDENSSFKLAMSSTSEQEIQRLQILQAFDLLESGNLPIFDEATQTAAHFLNMPICVLGLLDHDRLWFKSAVGLSRIGLMNSLVSSRQLARQEAFCTRVVETQRVLAIADATMEPDWAAIPLVQRYGIRSYLGVPLYTSSGHCIGTLAVMGLTVRHFTEQEIAFLELTARWSMSEFERERLQQPELASASTSTAPLSEISTVKTSLLSQMSQELCTPLTSILGMAKVLNQGIYGALSHKQQEYIQIIHDSGQYLLSLINEIVELGTLNEQSHDLNLSAADVEMLCQQVIAALTQAAQRRDLQMQVTVEPGNRIWLLDKDKVRHLLYHLVFSLIQSSSPESTIRMHVSRKHNHLQMTIWSSHPWLNEDLPQSVPARRPSASASFGATLAAPASEPETRRWAMPEPTPAPAPETRESLGILLSRRLVELHSGAIALQGSAETGYRYVIRLPQLKSSPEA